MSFSIHLPTHIRRRCDEWVREREGEDLFFTGEKEGEIPNWWMEWNFHTIHRQRKRVNIGGRSFRDDMVGYEFQGLQFNFVGQTMTFEGVWSAIIGLFGTRFDCLPKPKKIVFFLPNTLNDAQWQRVAFGVCFAIQRPQKHSKRDYEAVNEGLNTQG